jgi:hypothetical protein
MSIKAIIGRNKGESRVKMDSANSKPETLSCHRKERLHMNPKEIS